MMHGREKSDPAIVAMKSPNKTGRPAAEAMERRVGARDAIQHRTRRTQSRESVSGAGARTGSRKATEDEEGRCGEQRSDRHVDRRPRDAGDQPAAEVKLDTEFMLRFPCSRCPRNGGSRVGSKGRQARSSRMKRG